ncbi:IS5/IS1182 family transposase, partial [Alicyclobacillus fodiniaquatilis]
SWNRRTRFKGTNIFQELFDEIVLQGIKHHMIGGRVLMTDSIHIKANANKRKFVHHEVELTPKDYVKELDEAVEKDRMKHGKKPL